MAPDDPSGSFQANPETSNDETLVRISTTKVLQALGNVLWRGEVVQSLGLHWPEWLLRRDFLRTNPDFCHLVFIFPLFRARSALFAATATTRGLKVWVQLTEVSFDSIKLKPWYEGAFHKQCIWKTSWHQKLPHLVSNMSNNVSTIHGKWIKLWLGHANWSKLTSLAFSTALTKPIVSWVLVLVSSTATSSILVANSKLWNRSWNIDRRDRLQLEHVLTDLFNYVVW